MLTSAMLPEYKDSKIYTRKIYTWNASHILSATISEYKLGRSGSQLNNFCQRHIIFNYDTELFPCLKFFIL